MSCWLDRLSPSAKDALLWAEGFRKATGAVELYTEYLLAGLYQKEGSFTQKLLTLFDDDTAIRSGLEDLANQMTSTSIRLEPIHPALPDVLLNVKVSANLEEALNEAAILADEKGSKTIRTRHLLAGLLAVQDSWAGQWISEKLQVDQQELYQLITTASEAQLPLDKIRQASPRYESALILRGHTGSVNSVAFSPDNRLVVSGSADGSIRIWDVTNGKMSRLIQGHEVTIRSTLFTPDGRYIISADKRGEIKTWDAQNGRQLLTQE